MTPIPVWTSEYLQDHALVGKIWHVKSGMFMEPSDLVTAMGKHDFALLGEKHDNADHHQIQAWLVGQLLKQGRKMAVAFEMFTTEQAEVLQAFQESGSCKASDFGPLTQWEKSGWPDWSYYAPIAQHALDANIPILAANMTRDQAMTMARQNKSFLSDKDQHRMGLDKPFPRDLTEFKALELIRSHCNMMPENMIEPMLLAQTTRDAVMADVMIEAANTPGLDGTILIAGAGHTRKYWAVPWHLTQRIPDKSVLSLGILEVDENLLSVDDYSDEFDTGSVPFDYIWFTPRVDMEDPCEKYAEQLKNMGKAKPPSTEE